MPFSYYTGIVKCLTSFCFPVVYTLYDSERTIFFISQRIFHPRITNKMPKITQNSKEAIATRNRVRFHRKVKLVLLNERRMFEMYMSSKEQKTEEVRSDLIDSNKQSLRCWALEHRIKRHALTDLLKILRSLGISWLPNDSRTFLKTPCEVEIFDAAGGKMWYDGIAKNLSRVYSGLKMNIDVSLNFNIDGMAPFKSSKKQFWPILASIHGNFTNRLL